MARLKTSPANEIGVSRNLERHVQRKNGVTVVELGYLRPVV